MQLLNPNRNRVLVARWKLFSLRKHFKLHYICIDSDESWHHIGDSSIMGVYFHKMFWSSSRVGIRKLRGHNKENVRTWSSLTIDPWVRGRAEAAWTWSYFCPTLLSFLPPARRCCCSNITTQFQLQFQQQRVSSCSCCCCCCCSLFREII